MTEILNNALQKLSETEMESSTLPFPSEATTEASTAKSVAVSEESAVTPSATYSPRRGHRNPVQFILDYRRQSAAVVLLLSLGFFWSDSGSQKDSTDATAENSDELDAEDLMLSEFDAVEVPSLREPAEPVVTPDNEPFPLTIPQVTETSSAATASGESGGHPLLNEEIGDFRPSKNRAESGSVSAQESSAVSSDSAAPSTPRSVRFTGRIQPLN